MTKTITITLTDADLAEITKLRTKANSGAFDECSCNEEDEMYYTWTMVDALESSVDPTVWFMSEVKWLLSSR